MKRIFAILLCLMLVLTLCPMAMMAEGTATQTDVEATATDMAATSTDVAAEPLTVTAVGCTLRYLDSEGKGAGAPMSEIRFDEAYVNPVTGEQLEGGVVAFEASMEVPQNSKMGCWVIDGVRYDFESKVFSIVVEDLKQSMVIEAVLENEEPTTQWTPDMGSDEEALTAESVSAHMNFFRPDGEKLRYTGKGFTSLDFAHEYANVAWRKQMPGGSADLRVQAEELSFQQVNGWYVNGVKLTPDHAPRYFFATGLHQSMTFEPVYGVRYVVVECYNCTFSGAGYENARNGYVPVGSQITVKRNGKPTDYVYYVNGRAGHRNKVTFDLTVNYNLKIVCEKGGYT